MTSIIIGCDHAAYILKEKIKAYLVENGIDVEDVGAYSEDSIDYSDIAIKVASMVSTGKFERGILLCGTGIGMSMAANRYPRVRAAFLYIRRTAIYTVRLRTERHSGLLLISKPPGGMITDSRRLEIRLTQAIMYIR